MMLRWGCSRLDGQISSREGRSNGRRPSGSRKGMRRRGREVGDWIGNAIEELKGEQAAIEGYGLDGYFKRSVVRLEGLRDGGDGVAKNANEETEVDSRSD
jgi:hypothetical protein